MIAKKCDRCGAILPVGQRCKCNVKQLYKKYDTDIYSPEIEAFYHSAEWQDARERCISRCHGIDLYSWYILHRIELGSTVHHIVPIVDDWSLRLSPDNLICLSESSHRLIHKLYRTEYDDTVRVLRGLLRRI